MSIEAAMYKKKPFTLEDLELNRLWQSLLAAPPHLMDEHEIG